MMKKEYDILEVQRVIQIELMNLEIAVILFFLIVILGKKY